MRLSILLAAFAMIMTLPACGGEADHADHDHEDGSHAHEHGDHEHGDHEHAKESAGKAAGSSKEAAPFVNEVCPVMTDETPVADFIVEFEGKKIGLCCEDCLVEWEDMTDAERREQLAAIGIR